MKQKANDLLQSSLSWLSSAVFPLWTERGIADDGSFFEALEADGHPSPVPRRAMVQARQIFSYVEAVKMNVLSSEVAVPLVRRGTDALIEKYGLPSGAFGHAVDGAGRLENPQSELYTQAFVLFGLAQSYELVRSAGASDGASYKSRAKTLLAYLQRERRHPAGGYVEIKNNEILFQSNPHMHLFEAAVCWARVDSDPAWADVCHEVFRLCMSRFIDSATGALCEHFDRDWQKQVSAGRFFFEPGHHFEWAWLLHSYLNLFKHDLSKETVDTATVAAARLYALAEAHGVVRGFAVDEVWSDFSVKKPSSRFWPQTERIKAAVELGRHARTELQPAFATAADEALTALWTYLDSPARGLWQDTRNEHGEFIPQPSKASSLYHIILAISEYATKRPLLMDRT
jgi:mannose-6-phosphate isomerase